jgi:hypothetical protein
MRSVQEDTMALRFIGVDPNTPNTGSPTVWVDEDDGSVVLQGWKITDAETMAQIQARGPIPDHETVLRLPGRMASFLREAGEWPQNR